MARCLTSENTLLSGVRGLEALIPANAYLCFGDINVYSSFYTMNCHSNTELLPVYFIVIPVITIFLVCNLIGLAVAKAVTYVQLVNSASSPRPKLRSGHFPFESSLVIVL
jgi:glucan phosphoethanolaminetransferase (alkaline phosphatase superfamily)